MIPCKNCLTYIMCKQRAYNMYSIEELSVADIAYDNKCGLLEDYLTLSGIDGINACRELFGFKRL